jgi:hypothetical protein
VDKSLANEDVAIDGFQEAIKLLESLTLNTEDSGLEQRVRFPAWLCYIISLDPEKVISHIVSTLQRLSVLGFVKNQLAEKQPDTTLWGQVSLKIIKKKKKKNTE